MDMADVDYFSYEVIFHHVCWRLVLKQANSIFKEDSMLLNSSNCVTRQIVDL